MPSWAPKVAAVGGAAALILALKYLESKKASAGGSTTKPAAKPAASGHHADEEGGMSVKDSKEKQAELYIKEVGGKWAAKASKDELNSVGDLSKYLSFQSEYKTNFTARPDVGEGVLLKVTDWRLLTPQDYDRTCFHVEVDIAGTSIEKLCNGAHGKALSVYATNDQEKVATFLKAMKLDPYAVVPIEEIAPPEEDGVTVLTTLEKLFMQYLDLFGKPTREFLKKLFPYAVDIQEKVAIAELTLERKMEEFQDRQARALTYADYFLEFPSLKIPADKYVELVPTIKQRVYSICSSSDYRPGKCQLLVVREDWQAKGGDTKFGLCSSFLTFVRPGGWTIGHSTHSVMNMPEDKSVPVYMAGLGTGLAPFRAFVEQRKCEKSKGIKVGPMTLFFGGRYSKAEYYYRDEFEAFEAEGLVKCCNAWSRDTAKKVYVQHKITEEGDNIWRDLGMEGSKGAFFLCGSKQPEKDVFAAILQIFQTKGGMTEAQSRAKMEQLQAAGRYVTEVY
jgi:sulfite reductase (NADPH) flavoprotein alpha-component